MPAAGRRGGGGLAAGHGPGRFRSSAAALAPGLPLPRRAGAATCHSAHGRAGAQKLSQVRDAPRVCLRARAAWTSRSPGGPPRWGRGATWPGW